MFSCSDERLSRFARLPALHRRRRKTVFLAALRRGARRGDAADEAGFSLTGFHGARRRDPAFAAAWTEALAGPPPPSAALRPMTSAAPVPSEIEGRSGSPAPTAAPFSAAAAATSASPPRARKPICPASPRIATRSPPRRPPGVSVATVSYHRRNDPAFAEAHELALEQGYVHLEAEALRQRLAARRRLREEVEAAGLAAPLLADEAAEFERVMRLLARRDRRPRRPEAGFMDGGRRREWTFDEAIAALDKRLRSLGLRSPDPPAEGG